MMSLAFVRDSRAVLELALIGKQFGKRPSDLFGIVDRGVALDFDRLCSQRLLFFDLECKQREAEALHSNSSGANAPPQFRGSSDEVGGLIPEAKPN